LRRIGEARSRNFFKPDASTRLGKKKIKKFLRIFLATSPMPRAHGDGKSRTTAATVRARRATPDR
jgi:hypothetical protein